MATNRGSHYLSSIARLKPGVTLTQARADIDAVALRMEEQNPGLKIVGCVSPPVGTVVEMESESILEQIESARPDVLRGLLPGDGASEVEEAVMNWYEEQMVRGRAEGRRAMLLKLLRVRFGELPADIIARIEAADSAELDVWAEHVVTASSLDDVLSAA